MQKMVAVITGANSGIGKETARYLTRRGYHVVMVCRNASKAETAKTELEQGIQGASLDIELCDLSNMQDVRNLGERLRQKHPQLHRLINNAGILSPAKRELTDEGFEKTFATNHLAYFLLTRKLLPVLKATPGARIINVASDAHRYGRFQRDNVQLERGYNTSKAYGNSKLFNIMFTHELAKQLKGTGVSAYSLHPGVVNTHFARNNRSFFGLMFNLGRLFMISPEKGAQTTNYLATEPDIESLSGNYFSGSKLASAAPAATKDDDCRALWTYSESCLS